jgi:peptidoglycan hydrolase-like protein with peptidoglycan-binding domain
MTAEAMGMGGIGLYKGFTHIDTRDDPKARWDQRSGSPVGVSTFFQTIKYGSSGEYVRIAQRKLGVSVDGIFGNNTKNAVIAFQDNKNLVADGIVGRLTWTELMK